MYPVSILRFESRVLDTTLYLAFYYYFIIIVVFFFVFREKEDDLEQRFMLLDQELRDILAIEGKKESMTLAVCYTN